MLNKDGLFFYLSWLVIMLVAFFILTKIDICEELEKRFLINEKEIKEVCYINSNSNKLKIYSGLGIMFLLLLWYGWKDLNSYVVSKRQVIKK